MNAILGLILNVLWLYTIVIFAMVIMSWLIAFNVVNLHNNFVAQLVDLVALGFGQVGRGRALDDLLVAPLNRTIPFEQVH